MKPSAPERARGIEGNLVIIFCVTLIAIMGVASISPAFPKMARELSITQLPLIFPEKRNRFIYLRPLPGGPEKIASLRLKLFLNPAKLRKARTSSKKNLPDGSTALNNLFSAANQISMIYAEHSGEQIGSHPTKKLAQMGFIQKSAVIGRP